jgi:L-ascorbate metabolism protein UlaG (beta-lactamase superfamily)
MKITKLGHCCLLIEENGVRIMTDPGSFTIPQQEQEKNIDLILISHEHQDHLHVDSVKKVLISNPQAVIISNSAVYKILEKEGIACQIVEKTMSSNFKNIQIEACDHKHGPIYQDYGQVQNTGYFVNNKFYYPGDCFSDPGKPVEILAVPVAGPWLRIGEAIDYAKQINPKNCFPVHDGMIIPQANFGVMVLQHFLKSSTNVAIPEIGKEMEF